MSNNITIELSKEDRNLLEGLMGSVTLLASVLANSQPTAAEPSAPAQELATPDTGHPVDEISPHAAAEPVAEPEPVKWTKDDLTKKVQALAAPGTGKREKVREIVKSYAPNVGAIPEDKYCEVMDKLTALEQEG